MKWNGVQSDQAIEGVSKLIKKNGIQIVDLKFNDLPGLWQHFSIPSSELTGIDDPVTSIWAEGIGFDGSSIRGFQQIQESDMILLPDAESVVVDPICEVPTASIICDVYDPITKQPYSRDPRYIAKKAEKYLAESGIADESFWGPEYEFFLFNDIRFGQTGEPGVLLHRLGRGRVELREGRAPQPRVQATVQGGLLPRPAA